MLPLFGGFYKNFPGSLSIVRVRFIQPAQTDSLLKRLAGVIQPGLVQVGALAMFVRNPEHGWHLVSDEAEMPLALLKGFGQLLALMNIETGANKTGELARWQIPGNAFGRKPSVL